MQLSFNHRDIDYFEKQCAFLINNETPLFKCRIKSETACLKLYNNYRMQMAQEYHKQEGDSGD